MFWVVVRANPRATDDDNLPTTERLFWHCGALTAEPKVVPIGTIPPIPPIPDYQNLLFSVARGNGVGGRNTRVEGAWLERTGFVRACESEQHNVLILVQNEGPVAARSG